LFLETRFRNTKDLPLISVYLPFNRSPSPFPSFNRFYAPVWLRVAGSTYSNKGSHEKNWSYIWHFENYIATKNKEKWLLGLSGPKSHGFGGFWVSIVSRCQLEFSKLIRGLVGRVAFQISHPMNYARWRKTNR
jgi:hypothetical protein